MSEALTAMSTTALKWKIRELGQRFCPRTTLALLARRTWVFEPELDLLPYLCKRRGMAIDAGANKGIYLYRLAKLFKAVAGFEPHPALADYLRRAAPKNVTIHPVALSDVRRESVLSLPEGFIELGSLEPDIIKSWATDRVVENHPVALAPLDTFEFDDVALIKIDVEGHEMALLHGARMTISRWRPSVLIEVEEQHAAGSVAAVRHWFEQHNYAGFFLDGARLLPIADFNAAFDQDIGNLRQSVKAGRYINNFLYFDRDEADQIVTAINKALRSGSRLRGLVPRPASAYR